MFAVKILVAVVVTANQTIRSLVVTSVFVKEVRSELIHAHFRRVSHRDWFFEFIMFHFHFSHLACPTIDCGNQGICVETDGITVVPGGRPIYYVCQCKNGYIALNDCNGKIRQMNESKKAQRFM